MTHITIVLLFFVFCAAQAASPPEMPEEFTQILRKYESAWAKKDAKALAALFIEDGFALPNKHAPVRGRENIREFYQGQGGELHLRALHYASDGNAGYIIGVYSLSETGPEIGKFTLTMHKNKDGDWLIVSDMDNPNQG